MRKFECKKCKLEPCILEVVIDVIQLPKACPYGCKEVNWQEIKMDSAETTQTTVKYEKCFAWVKVGEWVYSAVYKEYVQISDIDEFNVSFNSGTCCSVGHKSFLEDYVPARKRKFNDKEMQSLVGKVLQYDGFTELVTSYNEQDKTISSMYFIAKNADWLMNYAVIIEGKPCFKLEHLDEKGQWIE